MIYVISDIHGHQKQFNDILHQIAFSESDELYILGDVVDKGPDSIPLLKQIMEMPNAKMLMGNHDQMMLDSLTYVENKDDPWDDNYEKHLWYRNYGQATEEAFNLEPSETQGTILKFLAGLPFSFDITVNGKDYKLVHAAPIELFDKYGKYAYRNETRYVLWHRFEPLDEIIPNKVLIYGHTPTMHYQDCIPAKIWYGDNRIDIDCGAAYKGRVACLRLDDMAEFYSDTQENLDEL